MSQPAQTTPQADGSAPAVPNQAAPAPQPAPAIDGAPPALGAVQPTPAPAPKRTRAPRGPLPPPTTVASSVGVPALLELGAANPLYTIMRRDMNTFVPNAINMFYMLGICDMLMSTTDRFLRSTPSWLPIVSQYYISVLWIVQIIRIRIETRYGSPEEIEIFKELCEHLQIQNLLIPGPLVPFFAALASASADADWIGDFMPGLPTVAEMIGTHACLANQWQRVVPFPVFLLDMLKHFATEQADKVTHTGYEWTRNIFGITSTPVDPNHVNVTWNRLGPNFVAPLYCSSSQFDAARAFWNVALNAGSYTRYTRANALLINNFAQFLGFIDGAGLPRIMPFTIISTTMSKYAMFFNGSLALKSISPINLGAIIPRGLPTGHANVRNWLYPAAAPGAQTSATFSAIHELPREYTVSFVHADRDLEEVAEQYAVTTFINVDLSQNNNAQNGWNQLAHDNSYVGSAWSFTPHRQCIF